MGVPVNAGPSFGVPAAIQTQVPSGVNSVNIHCVLPRWPALLVNTQIGEPAPNPITVVLNWTAALKMS
jgi:hypothetical protein